MLRKALLVTYRDELMIEEALGLAEAAELKVLDVITVKNLGIGKYGLGEGKAKEVSERAKELGVDVIIVDEKLKVGQGYNLSKLSEREVMDREKLILEIFARRATTPEAKLQVKLARLIYELPRAKEIVRKERMGEQPGMHGYGRYEVDKYVRSITRQIHKLREKLEKVSKRREIHRLRRRKFNLPFISLAGYTGSGKTTLFNLLTKEGEKVTGKPFTTLSPTIRKYVYRDVGFFLSDTVGFIDRLPHYMIEAFKSTLEELYYADLVLLLLDISVPREEFERRLSTSLSVMAELGVEPTKVILVLNKADLVNSADIEDKRSLLPKEMNHIVISAKKGMGVRKLKELIYRRVVEGARLEITVERDRGEKLLRLAEWMRPLVKVTGKVVDGKTLSVALVGPEWALKEIKDASNEGS
jgi:GTP-binding protein HflX